MMKRLLLVLPVLLILGFSAMATTGCRHPAKKLKDIRLGFTPDEVEDEMGSPYAVRAAKLFEDEETTMIWEYRPPFLANNESIIHVIFENDKVVQWGVAGDYQTGSEKTVKEYKPKKAGG